MAIPKRKVSLKFTKQQIDATRTLIANMLIGPAQIEAGIISRVNEQGRYKLMPEMLPDDMKFEATILSYIYALAEEKRPPTKNIVLERLTLNAAKSCRKEPKSKKAINTRC